MYWNLDPETPENWANLEPFTLMSPKALASDIRRQRESRVLHTTLFRISLYKPFSGPFTLITGLGHAQDMGNRQRSVRKAFPLYSRQVSKALLQGNGPGQGISRHSSAMSSLLGRGSLAKLLELEQ